MRTPARESLAAATSLAVALLVAACTAGGPATSGTAPPISAAPPESASATRSPAIPAPTMTFPAAIGHQPDFAPVPAGTWWIDTNVDPAEDLIVEYTLPAGWTSWLGGFIDGPRPGPADPVVNLSIVQVANLVADGCNDQVPQDPPVGPSVADLATALARLDPFKVAISPRAAELAGYTGTYVELEVPDLVGPADAPFGVCDASALKSWISPSLSFAYYGYYMPGMREGLWILDVEGERLVISALRVPKVPPEAEAQLRAVLDSIVINP